jgi:hypothetical protein
MGKVAVHFEANSRITIAEQFQEPSRSGGQLLLSDSNRHASAYSDMDRVLCESYNGWDISSTYVNLDYTSTFSKTKERDMLNSAADMSVALSMFIADLA